MIKVFPSLACLGVHFLIKPNTTKMATHAFFPMVTNIPGAIVIGRVKIMAAHAMLTTLIKVLPRNSANQVGVATLQ